MPTKVIAQDGDCLCCLAMDAGFFDCAPLRALGENAPFLNRALRAGDEVVIPDLEIKDHPKAVDTKHRLNVKNSPPVSIRFVHGSPDLPYRSDSTTSVLHVSNFVTNLGGATGLAAFPTGFGFNNDGHQDPDTFKVEVVDPKAGGNLKVKLEALKPVYTPDAISGKLVATSFVEFPDAKRKIPDLECERVSATTSNVYRSRYMRLVVDEEDKDNAGVPNQCLFVSDLADGKGTGAAGDNDTLEILDQMVRATYEIPRCSGSPKCKVMAEAPIGGGDRQRVRVRFHAYFKGLTGEDSPHGESKAKVKENLRRRTFKWYRRVFAQGDMSPKLMDVHFLRPPAENMLCLSHNSGNTARGGAVLTFNIKAGTRNLPFSLTLIEGETPMQAGGRVVGALPAGFSGQALKCPRPSSALNDPADVLITADNGDRVTIETPNLVNGRMTVDVPRVDLMNVRQGDADLDGSIAFLTVDMKRIIRDIPVTDDEMHCVVIGEFDGAKTLRGQAFLPCLGTAPDFRPDLPFRSVTIMATKASGGVGVLDGGDTLPFTSPHESAHTLTDLIHTKSGTSHSRTELLGSGTSRVNAVGATKRLCDGPYTVQMEENTSAGSVVRNVSLVERIKSHGSNKLESW